MPQTHFAVIALGSNLAEPARQVRAALSALEVHPQIQIEKISSLYVTAPVGYDDQPDFVNAVCSVRTSLDGVSLLAVLNRIEADFGRERTFRNAPRTLDLDIIDFDGISSDDPHLTLPHPRAHERSFVMKPLAEILPDFVLGGHGRAADLAAALGDEGIRLLEAV
ncbi:2-amino-4-hydroxy-6-hydroxymethyldihydropteridine pyrophosphokinase [Neisseria sp. HMSC059F02]|uniref:2-amino-4-hydroxy-6- hydroxymethyldihydropteridine diphosphokinase n=1 Tax=Neisseria TaxID=482 RepID=UPI0008A5F272|nr:2-amino-4-hydroxy-6-hydroxymethyldihydropteridine diphosphokinase [Neisseria mucosa]OFM95652.1 2-amino-4-hydroxy-6-hydroxymethyldihydropteridine pyrophosphokinase [Neisseria sp. HMSC055F11]OFN30508.1 2-amino-4-hydroxy-6-hydroxymethyldihydropteridine pyrophosphokinase [Neisseria sp. HMSC059F02]OHR41931.1 2-amino-4-hydroxy-6-hydroxymethyldihydropteridine pyrophosphokinase [Neisseria sp. HMSC070E12]